MKIYNKQGSGVFKIPHGKKPLECNAFVVYARQGDRRSCHVCHTLIVAAMSEQDSIARVKANARTVIEALRQQAEPEELEAEEFFEQTGSEVDIRRVKGELEKFREIDDPNESELERIVDLSDELRKLLAPKSTGKHSVFSRRISRMQYLLSDETYFEAERIDGDRAIPVGYFDDSRDVSSL